MRTATETVTAYWATAEARDWAAFGELLADDVVYELPQSRERIHGRADVVRFNAEYPADWHVAVMRPVGEGRRASTWTTFDVAGEQQTGLSFFELDDDARIARITDFWPEPYDPPPGREHLAERY